MKKRKQYPRVDELLSKYDFLFRDEVAAGLPPKRSVQDSIHIEDGAKPSHRPLYHFSLAELVAAGEYVEDS